MSSRPKETPDGLYKKYYVERVDGRDQTGGDKEKARYFVLDYWHDPFALQALQFYAWACAVEYPQLADDITKEVREVANKKANLLRAAGEFDELLDWRSEWEDLGGEG